MMKTPAIAICQCIGVTYIITREIILRRLGHHGRLVARRASLENGWLEIFLSFLLKADIPSSKSLMH